MANLSDLLSGGKFEIIDRQVFTASGTWTKPATTRSTDIVVIDLWGAGGSGSWTRNSDGYNYSGGGGGGGQHCRYMLAADAVGGTAAVAVGAGGSAGYQQYPGSDGGDSTFAATGATLKAEGGKAGLEVAGGGRGGGDNGGARFSGTSFAFLAQKFGGGVNSVNYPYLAHTDHGGAAGGTDASTLVAAGSSRWGGAGGAAEYAGYGGVSLFGGDGGNSSGAAGVAPGGGGAGVKTASGDYAGAGARGEVRVYVVRGASPDFEHVFEV